MGGVGHAAAVACVNNTDTRSLVAADVRRGGRGEGSMGRSPDEGSTDPARRTRTPLVNQNLLRSMSDGMTLGYEVNSLS